MPFKTPLRALATSCTRETARAVRVRDVLSHRETFDQKLLGQLQSIEILVSSSRQTTFQIRQFVQSADITFRLTMTMESGYAE
jgi:hypothetical protein